MNIKYEFYALTYDPSDESKFIGIDSGSGGYPWEAGFIRCERFKTIEEAKNYQKHFKTLKIVKCSVNVECEVM